MISGEWVVGVSVWLPSGEEGLSLTSLPFLSHLYMSVVVAAPLPSSVGRKLLLLHPCSSFASIWAPPYTPRPCMPSPTPAAFLSLVLLGWDPAPRPSNPHVSKLPWLFCVARAPSALFPCRPHPFQKLCGGLGGRGIMNPWGGGGLGELSPCFLLLLTNLPFLCLDFDLSEETVGFY